MGGHEGYRRWRSQAPEAGSAVRGGAQAHDRRHRGGARHDDVQGGAAGQGRGGGELRRSGGGGRSEGRARPSRAQLQVRLRGRSVAGTRGRKRSPRFAPRAQVPGGCASGPQRPTMACPAAGGRQGEDSDVRHPRSGLRDGRGSVHARQPLRRADATPSPRQWAPRTRACWPRFVWWTFWAASSTSPSARPSRKCRVSGAAPAFLRPRPRRT